MNSPNVYITFTMHFAVVCSKYYVLFILLCCVYRGRTGVFVCGLLPHSAAMECGKISIGDQIIEVNGVDMRQATVDEAADIMVNSTCTTLFRTCSD